MIVFSKTTKLSKKTVFKKKDISHLWVYPREETVTDSAKHVMLCPEENVRQNFTAQQARGISISGRKFTACFKTQELTASLLNKA